MSTVYNVSDITNILSGTIQRNVLVRGEVEILADGPSNAFYLTNESNKLRCFIPPGVPAPILKQGQVVVVEGKITLFSSFSQYQITVSDMQVNGVNKNTFSVTEVTRQISRLVENTPALRNIQIQGTVFWAAVSNWDLIDVNSPPLQRIKCVQSGPIIVPVQVKNNVCVRGEVGIHPFQSEYQIKVTDIDRVPEAPTTPTCQCPGCKSCQLQKNLCPPLQDPEYELCARCYHESPDHEDRVVQAVYAYFDALGGNGFSPRKEQHIQIGNDDRRADVVLVRDGSHEFAAIAECKGAGYEGNGRSQLNSYLSASNTRFGIFANRADPSQWEFYKEQGRNQYESITCDQFKKEVKELTDPDLPSTRDRIDTLESENEQLKQTQRSLKEKFDRIKVFLTSAMQEVDQVKKED